MTLGILLDLLLILVGVGLIVCGIAHWSFPAALIVLGLALLAGGLLPVQRFRRP